MASGQPDDGSSTDLPTADDPAGHGGGDVAAFEALFAANHDDLLRYAARRVGPDTAADVVADVIDRAVVAALALPSRYRFGGR